MKMRAASQVRRAVAESRARSSRQLAASRSVDQVHTSAHAASAKASAGRQDERAEDRVRVGLFQAIERECVEAPGPRRAGLLHSEPERATAPQAEARGNELQPAVSAQASDSPRVSTERAESVAALVERIDAALKDGQPTLSLGLADRSGASSVEISRTAKGEVSVRISARPGRKAHLAAAGEEIKSALAARGLRLKSLEVG